MHASHMLHPNSHGHDVFKAHSADSSPISKQKNAHHHQKISPLKQRHSTGNLNAITDDPGGSRPTKGILKRPHTFHHDRQKPLSKGAQHQHFLFQPPIVNEEPAATSRIERVPKTVAMMKTSEESQKIPQHVEFSEMNAVAVFGDTTTDTEGGGESTAARQQQKASIQQDQQQPIINQRKGGLAPPSAIISPYIRQTKNEPQPSSQQQPEMNDFETPRHGNHDWSPEGSESGGSIRSGGGQSHIVGKWWFGPTTKFVVHCDRRGGCSHRHSREGTPEDDLQSQEPYLTPTQRHQKEVGALKKELRRTQMACREKERHLGQLRDRLTEIETMMSSSSNTQMVRLAQMRQKIAEKEEEFIVEREALIARHEHKVRQLVQETVDLRAELARKEKILAERDRIQYKDQAVQIDEESKQHSSVTTVPKSPSSDAPVTADPETMQIGQEKTENGVLFPSTSGVVSHSAPVSPSKAPIVQIGAELLATLEAYRSETVVWRTRCANLELIMQDLLLRENAKKGDAPLGSTLFINLENDPSEEEERVEAHQSNQIPEKSLEKTEKEQSLQPGLRKECQLPSCTEIRRRFAEEKEKLTERTNSFNQELETLRKRDGEVEKQINMLKSEIVLMAKEQSQLATLAETRLNESKALKLTLVTVQTERDKFEKAISYLERRCEAMELVGLDQGIILTDEPPEINGPLEKEFIVRGSKATQTELTVYALGLNEKTMDELQIRLRIMQNTFSEDKAQMGIQLAEIEHILQLKTELVNKLTDQLDEAARRSREENEQHQRERDMFTERIYELGKKAERIPILESEMERAMIDKSRCELRLREMEETMDDAMERALDTALDKNRIREEYWSERLDAVEMERKELKARLEHERRVAADERMKWSLEKTELDRRLTSAIEHIGLLNARINCPRRDAQCEVRPRTLNKYVICRPNQKDQEIGTDLRDMEMDELKLEITRLANEREMLLGEMKILETEAQQATEMIQKERLRRIEKIRGPADFLTVSFHSKNELVEFDGINQSGRSTGADLITQSDAISIMSLPTVLEHVEAIATKPYSNSSNLTVDDGEDHLKSVQIHRDVSLQPTKIATPVRLNSTENRCHSAPRRQEIDQSQHLIRPKSSHIIQQEQQMIASSLQIPTIQISSAGEVRQRILALQRIKELMKTCVTSEIPCAIGEEELFDQLDTLLRAIAENEKRSWESQQKIEELKRENCRLQERIKDAEMELWIYRTEPRRAAVEKMDQGCRSFSAEHLGNGPPLAKKQLIRWKEIAGTCFREVNQLRKRLAISEDERLTFRNQMVILKGELEMSKCQNLHSALMKRGTNFGDEAIGETLKSYNRWLGGDRWQSVPELNEEDLLKRSGKRRKIVTEVDKEQEIVSEALRMQCLQLRQERDRLQENEQNMAEELRKKQNAEEQLDHGLKKVKAECELLRRENGMYEQKLVETDRDRQQMYLVMFRKGQQAANQALDDDLDKAAELQIVLRFLHDAFFYYLLNKGNAREHLQAIMTMLNFTLEQKEEVYKRRGKSH